MTSPTTNSWVRTVTPALPSLKNNTADAERLGQALAREFNEKDIFFPLAVLRDLPGALRPETVKQESPKPQPVRCALFPKGSGLEVVEVAPVNSAPPTLGLAVDLGSTGVLVRILDLRTRATLAEAPFTNPQTSVGPDILTRVHYADKPGGLAQLREMISSAIRKQTLALCEQNNLDPARILLGALAGNTAMTHLFLGLPPRNLVREPYIPVANRPGVFSGAELGLGFSPRTRLFVFPNVGSYFGGDLTAGILASGMHEREEVSILIDVGTNAEVVVGCKDWMMACAGAAGPALESGVSAMGMAAAPGAIDRVAIDPATREFSFTTISNQPAVGICGSGVIDLAAQLFLSGMMDLRGRIVPRACAERYREIDGVRAVVVATADESGTGRDLVFTQVDLDSLKRSKAAMYTILRTLTREVGMEFSQIHPWFVAGAFGAYIDPRSAIAIGMIPDLPLASYESLGNTSMAGAQRFLFDASANHTVDSIAGRLTYLELNVNQEFMNRFSAAKFFPHTEPSLFPSVKPWKENRALGKA